jgi:hypothetical protein
VLPTPLGDVGILICYESTDPALVRRLVRAGARTLIFVTNEAWFAGPAGARQHAMFAVLRAAESGRDAVRAASTGPSLHANAEGRVLAWLPWDESGYTISRIQGPRPWTPYVRFGDAWIAAAAALAALSAWPWLRQAAASADLRALWSAALWPGVAAVVGLAAQAAWPADIVRVAASGAVAIAAIRAAGSRGTGVRGGMPAASVIGAAVIGALAIAAVVEAYAAQGFPKRVASPGLWLAPLGIAVAAAIGEEVWLRGGVVGALAARPWVAVAFSVGATWGLHLNAPPELAAWRLTAAAAYAAVRIRSASVWGPALVRGAVEAALVRLLSLSSTG